MIQEQRVILKLKGNGGEGSYNNIVAQYHSKGTAWWPITATHHSQGTATNSAASASHAPGAGAAPPAGGAAPAGGVHLCSDLFPWSIKSACPAIPFDTPVAGMCLVTF